MQWLEPIGKNELKIKFRWFMSTNSVNYGYLVVSTKSMSGVHVYNIDLMYKWCLKIKTHFFFIKSQQSIVSLCHYDL